MARPRKVEFSGGRGKQSHGKWWAWVDLNHRPRPYQGALWCYMHSSVAMIALLTTSISRSGKPLRAPMPKQSWLT